MKKLVLFVAVVIAISLSACKKTTSTSTEETFGEEVPTNVVEETVIDTAAVAMDSAEVDQ